MKVLEEIKKENSILKEEILRIREEKKKLIEEVERLTQVIKRMEEEKKKLIDEVDNLKREREEVKELCEAMHSQLENVFEKFKESSAEFIVRVLEEFSFSLPQTEALKEDLEKIFSELINYKLPVKLYMNPKDYESLEGYILSLKERLRREGLEVQVITDDKLSVGEVQIKSEQFHIERSPREFARAIFEEVFRHVFKGY
ncbi:FliH/SctL family protein [Aquifex sp.]